MHAMLVDTAARRLDHLQIAFLEAGIHVTGSGSMAVAECCLRRAVVNVLVIEEAGVGPHMAKVIDLAQARNPRLAAILLTSNVARATERYTERFPSLHCVLDAYADPKVVARMALASVAGQAVCKVRAPEPVARQVRDMAADVPVFASTRRQPQTGTLVAA